MGPKEISEGNVSGYKVFVDDNFHYMNDECRYELGVFTSFEKAVAACKRIVDADRLARGPCRAGLSARAVHDGLQLDKAAGRIEAEISPADFPS